MMTPNRSNAKDKSPQAISPSFLERLAYGLGTLAFLLAPMLIPGTNLSTALLESVGVAMVITPVFLAFYAIFRALSKQPTSRRFVH